MLASFLSPIYTGLQTDLGLPGNHWSLGKKGVFPVGEYFLEYFQLASSDCFGQWQSLVVPPLLSTNTAFPLLRTVSFSEKGRLQVS